MKVRLAIFFMVVCVGSLKAQEFRVKTGLSEVPASAFYQVPITPELTVHARPDFSDIRIVDEKGRHVPYVIKSPRPGSSNETFIEFPILSNTTDSSSTTIELQGREFEGTGELSLLIANTAVERYTSISGSNDRKNWYIIDDNIRLQQSGRTENGSFVQAIRFPYIRYAYFKLVIHNAKTDPLNILKAGISKDTIPQGDVYLANPAPHYRLVDSARRSYIFISQDQPYLTDRLHVKLKGPAFFKRDARLYLDDGKGKPAQAVSFFNLSSENPGIIPLNGRKEKRYILVIDNLDSPPLEVEGIYSDQLRKHLVAFLDGGKQYSLLAGNPSVNAPQYDLAQFRDRIPSNISSIGFGALVANAQEDGREDHFSMNYLLWIVIAMGILVLGYLSYKLVGEMRSRES
jgi:hypothetical protein